MTSKFQEPAPEEHLFDPETEAVVNINQQRRVRRAVGNLNGDVA